MYDRKNLSKMKDLATHAPEAMKSFVAFDKAAVADEAIPAKYKELMALSVAFTTQCPYCIDIHADNARGLGTADQEIAKAVLVAAALRAGGAITPRHSCLEGQLKRWPADRVLAGWWRAELRRRACGAGGRAVGTKTVMPQRPGRVRSDVRLCPGHRARRLQRHCGRAGRGAPG